MKKTYIQPQYEVIKIATQQMLATSLGISEEEVYNENDLL